MRRPLTPGGGGSSCWVFHVKHWTGCRPISTCCGAGSGKINLVGAGDAGGSMAPAHPRQRPALALLAGRGAHPGRSRQRRRAAGPDPGGAGGAGRSISIESDRRKAAFLREAARACGATGNGACAADRERAAARGRRDHGARLGAADRTCWRWPSATCTPGTTCLFLKGREAASELTRGARKAGQ